MCKKNLTANRETRLILRPWLFKLVLMAEPMRQCMVCRKRDGKTSFFRIVRMPDGRTVFDPGCKINGRGVYVCKRAECIRTAKEKNLAETALKICIPGSVYFDMAQAFERQETGNLVPLLGFAVRSGKALFGVTSIQNAARKGNVRLILLEEDAGARTRHRIARLLRTTPIPMIRYRGVRSLETLVGKPNCKCIGIVDGHFADSIRKADHG